MEQRHPNFHYKEQFDFYFFHEKEDKNMIQLTLLDLYDM